MTFTRVPLGITCTIAKPMHKENTSNELPLVTMRRTPTTKIIIICPAPQALKSPTDKELRDILCISISRRHFEHLTPQGLYFYRNEFGQI